MCCGHVDRMSRMVLDGLAALAFGVLFTLLLLLFVHFAFQCVRCASGETLRWTSLKLHTASRTQRQICRLEFGALRTTKSGCVSYEAVEAVIEWLWRCSQAEKCVILDGALPQVLARLFIDQIEYERVLLFVAVVVVLRHNYGELFLCECYLFDFWPVKQADLLLAFKNKDYQYNCVACP